MSVLLASACGPVVAAAAAARKQTCSSLAEPHAWPQGWAPARRGSSSGVRCQAKTKGDVGRLLRDAMTQPAPGSNLTYLAAANYLRGVLSTDNQAELNRVLDIAMNPNSLFQRSNRKQPTNPHARKLDVEADMKPVVAFLTEEAALSQAQAAKVILAYPAVLCFSVDDRLRPFFSYLTAPEPLGLSPGEAAQVLERRPTLVGMGVASLQRVVSYLFETGTAREEVVEMLATSL